MDNVLYQLKFRYDREVDRCERSALKRIFECDDSASKPMVLCVAAVKPVKPSSGSGDHFLTSDSVFMKRFSVDPGLSRI